MNNDPARQAFDRLYGHLNLSAEDAAWHVFKSGWEAREQPAAAQEPVAWLVVSEYSGGKRLDIEWNVDADVMAFALGRLALCTTPPAPAQPWDEAAVRQALEALGWVQPNEQPSSEATLAPAQSLGDEQIYEAIRNSADELLDHIYEYGTAAEGVMERILSVARTAIGAAHGITKGGAA